ncbi:MAG: S9 family peptidase [Proteobacteria bacterium]|nr:S9 family peptidase [Pseudomonadota bacterium]
MKKIVFMIALSVIATSCTKAPETSIEAPVSEPSAIEATSDDASQPEAVAVEQAPALDAYGLTAHPANRPGDDFDELFGQRVPDPYRWLEDASNDDVQTWIKAQDSRARTWLSQLPTRAGFETRLAELLDVAAISTPIVRKQKAFYFERGPKDEKSIVYVKDLANPQAEPRVLLDPNKLSDDGSISIGDIYPDPNGKLMAYTLKKNNADQATVYIMDVETGQNLEDKIEGGRYADPEWDVNYDGDSYGFYYTWFPTDESIPVDERPGKTEIRMHRLGTDSNQDPIIVKALDDPTKFHYVSLSEDHRVLSYMIQDGWNGNTLKYQNLHKKEPVWIELPTQKNMTYMPIVVDGIMYLLTNDDSPKYKIVKIDLQVKEPKLVRPNLSKDKWKVIVPESEDSVIQDFAIVDNKLFVVTLKDVVNELNVYSLNGRHLKTIDLPDKGSIGTMHGLNKDKYLYFKFTSFKLPASVYRIDAKTMEMTVWKEIETPAATQDIISEQLFATSKDGTKVPMFVLRHKDTPLDGTAKTMIYGYGGFNVSITPTFNSTIYPWLEKGGIYVYSILRGGGEYGEKWHQDGMGMKKQNVFDDYFAVAEYLIEHKYTRSESLAAYGGSNGGLLMGAAMTQRPDLYGAIVCAVPLLDMIRYQKFGSGRTWIGEYGNAENSEEEFKNIYAYTPYSHVTKRDYPSILFLGADSDDRVDPMHARKMTAAIQDNTTSDKPVLLRVEKNSGHGGADMKQATIAKQADIFAYLQAILK